MPTHHHHSEGAVFRLVRGLLGERHLWLKHAFHQFIFDRCALRQQLPERLLAWRIAKLRPLPLFACPTSPSEISFTILMPVCDPAPQDLARALTSLQAQTYPRWRLICADDASGSCATADQLSQAAVADSRITVSRSESRLGIAATTERARELAAGADWLVFMDHDDVLFVDALARLAAAISAAPQLGLIYTDECKVDAGARLYDAAYKPAWSPALLLGQNYINHLTAIRADAVAEAGGLRTGFDGAQDLDLILRVSECLRTDQIGHVPAIAYAWRHRRRSRAFSRTRGAEAAQAGLRATTEGLARQGVTAEVNLTPEGWRRVRPALPNTPLISVVIPTHEGGQRFGAALETALAAEWPALEVLVVDHEVQAPGFAAAIARANERTPTRTLPWRGAFNYAAMMNRAVAEVRGELILLLNDDVSAKTSDWLRTIAGWMAFDDIAAVGPTLLYPSGRIQHAGLALGIGGAVGSPFKHQTSLRKGPFGRLMLTREVSAVTGACLLTRKSDWDAVGGMDEAVFPIAFNDVDYCLKLWAAGRRVVWTPDAVLTHHEGATRGRDVGAADAARLAADRENLRARWGAAIADDPFHHPVWSRASEDLRATPFNSNAPVRLAQI